MFAVVEDFEATYNQDDKAITCTSHTETREAAERDVREQKQISWSIAVEKIEYRIIEFKGSCPNCGRNFEF